MQATKCSRNLIVLCRTALPGGKNGGALYSQTMTQSCGGTEDASNPESAGVGWNSTMNRCNNGITTLHDANNKIATVDSMSRVHSRLKTGWGGMEDPGRVGPTTAVLEAVKGVGNGICYDESTPAESDTAPDIMPDPNGSMWIAAPRLTSKGRKSKSGFSISKISKYYLARMEEDKTIRAVVEEPFVIGKISGKRKLAPLTEDDIEYYTIRKKKNIAKTMPTEEDLATVTQSALSSQGTEPMAASSTSLFRSYRNALSGSIMRRGIHTTKVNLTADPCVPKPLPPESCVVRNDPLPRCDQPPSYQWPPICKISLCGCLPPHPRLCIPDCDRNNKPTLSLGKKPEYDCPSFSECARANPMNISKEKECGYNRKFKCLRNQIGTARRKPFIWSVERMELALGQQYWTRGQCQQQEYHTSSVNLDKKNEEECRKTGQLPCHKVEYIDGAKPVENKQKGACDKICMPCCGPARIPPTCFASYVKPPCTKFRNPRPAFSECRKMFPMKHDMCECEVPRKPICGQEKQKGSGCTPEC